MTTRASGRQRVFAAGAAQRLPVYQRRHRDRLAINKLRQTRAVATRYDKRDFVYRGTIDVASIKIWLRDPPQTHSRDTA